MKRLPRVWVSGLPETVRFLALDLEAPQLWFTPHFPRAVAGYGRLLLWTLPQPWTAEIIRPLVDDLICAAQALVDEAPGKTLRWLGYKDGAQLQSHASRRITALISSAVPCAAHLGITPPCPANQPNAAATAATIITRSTTDQELMAIAVDFLTRVKGDYETRDLHQMLKRLRSIRDHRRV